jgi:hypothetical protein
MWPPKRWEIESGHIRISSWIQGERRRTEEDIVFQIVNTFAEKYLSMAIKPIDKKKKKKKENVITTKLTIVYKSFKSEKNLT